jgi:hypothetical protein
MEEDNKVEKCGDCGNKAKEAIVRKIRARMSAEKEKGEELQKLLESLAGEIEKMDFTPKHEKQQ